MQGFSIPVKSMVQQTVFKFVYLAEIFFRWIDLILFFKHRFLISFLQELVWFKSLDLCFLHLHSELASQIWHTIALYAKSRVFSKQKGTATSCISVTISPLSSLITGNVRISQLLLWRRQLKSTCFNEKRDYYCHQASRLATWFTTKDKLDAYGNILY